MTEPQSDLESSYDRVAQRYAEEYFAELERKPFDRKLLDDFAATVGGPGEVCEIGCGPGQIARYLKDRSVNVCGVDLSEQMVKTARRLNPDIKFEQSNMLALNVPDESFAGVVSFYAIIHLKRDDMTRALKEMNRVLQPGGRLLVSFHCGEGELHRDEWYGQPVSVDVTLMTSDEMAGYLKVSGLAIERIIEREAYDFEYPTKRVYALAKKPRRS